MRLVVCILLFPLLFSTISTLAQRQGIYGEVFWLSGNQMPDPAKITTGKVEETQQGIVREILVYAPTRIQDVEQIADGLFTNIKTTLIAKTLSAPDGSFSVKLPPGEYSVFVQERKGLFANLFDKENRINLVTVKAKQYSWVTISVEYETVN